MGLRNHGRKMRYEKITFVTLNVPGVPTSFRQEFSKKSLNVTKSEKTRESLFTL